MNTLNQSPTVLGLDMGAGAFKLYSATPDKATSLFFSQVAAPQTQYAVPSLLGLRALKGYYTIYLPKEDITLYAGKGAHKIGRPVESFGHDRFRGAVDTQCLFYAALSHHSLIHNTPIDTLIVAVGLPLEFWASDDIKAKGERAGKQLVEQWLLGEHHWAVVGDEGDTNFTTRIVRVHVLPQAAGALYDYAINENLEVAHDLSKSRIGIISVGLNTVEIMLIEGGQPNNLRSRSTRTGVRQLLRYIDPLEQYTIAELDEDMREGKIPNKTIRAKRIIWAREVMSEIEKAWGDKVRADAVILTGGGTYLLEQELRDRFGETLYIPDDPIFSIARGLYKIATLDLRRKPWSAKE